MSSVDVSLSKIAADLPGLISTKTPDALVVDISHDSRQVTSGTLYVAIRGQRHDGHAFVKQAIDLGASALLVEEEQQLAIPQIVVRDTRRAMAWAARSVFGSPDTSLAIAGVTGTNGKSTVIHMVESILREAGISVGVIGTLGAAVGERPIPIARTTPEATDLQRILGTMRDTGVQAVAMEVSSHAIELHRSDAISFSVVGFTNLSHDHLDFHSDMDAYFAIKKRIFNDPPSHSSVVNIGDTWGRRLVDETDVPVQTVSMMGPADIVADDIDPSPSLTTFTIGGLHGKADVSLPLVGAFNVSNALVATGIAIELGARLPDVADGLHSMSPIVGRMQVVDHDGPFTVIVDYAHTPDAIAVVLAAARRVSLGRVISVLGAGGDRDKEKRPMMGAAAARFSDLVFVTSDNPRSEDPMAIANAVAIGANAESGAVVEIVIDRRDAIRAAVHAARSNDIVLVLGKGHETNQDRGTESVPFVDQTEVLEALDSQGWTDS